MYYIPYISSRNFRRTGKGEGKVVFVHAIKAYMEEWAYSSTHSRY